MSETPERFSKPETSSSAENPENQYAQLATPASANEASTTARVTSALALSQGLAEVPANAAVGTSQTETIFALDETALRRSR